MHSILRHLGHPPLAADAYYRADCSSLFGKPQPEAEFDRRADEFTDRSPQSGISMVRIKRREVTVTEVYHELDEPFRPDSAVGQLKAGAKPTKRGKAQRRT